MACRERVLAATKCPKMVGIKDLYQTLRSLRLDYREPFNNITDISANDLESLATVRIPNTRTLSPTGFEPAYVVHPASLDSMMQTILAVQLQAKSLSSATVLTGIEELTISTTIENAPGKALLVHATVYEMAPGNRKFDIMVYLRDGTDNYSSVLSVCGISQKFLSTGQTVKTAKPVGEEKRCYELRWVPDTRLLSLRGLIDLCSKPKQGSTDEDHLNAICSKYASAVAATVTSDNVVDQHRLLYDWIVSYATSDKATTNYCQDIYNDEFTGDREKLLHRVGSWLPQILTGAIEPLPLMLEDGMLGGFYASGESEHSYAQMASFTSLLCDQYPDLRILEVGAGTCGATLPILKALCNPSRGIFPSYDFTDISPSFFEKAK